MTAREGKNPQKQRREQQLGTAQDTDARELPHVHAQFDSRELARIQCVIDESAGEDRSLDDLPASALRVHENSGRRKSGDATNPNTNLNLTHALRFDVQAVGDIPDWRKDGGQATQHL